MKPRSGSRRKGIFSWRSTNKTGEEGKYLRYNTASLEEVQLVSIESLSLETPRDEWCEGGREHAWGDKAWNEHWYLPSWKPRLWSYSSEVKDVYGVTVTLITFRSWIRRVHAKAEEAEETPSSCQCLWKFLKRQKAKWCRKKAKKNPLRQDGYILVKFAAESINAAD